MNIGNQEILAGQIKTIEFNIAKLPSHSSIDISVTVARGKEPGPVLLLLGGLHGDEINGIEIVRRMIENKWNVPERGSTICIPILNIFGFIHFSRYVPDGKDVNRSFPGSKSGSLASRVAYYLMKEIIPKMDYGIDFHTGGDDRSNFPQVRCMMNDPENAELAKAFHAPFSLNSPYRPKSLRQSAAKLGKKILVYEGGESSRFDEHAIQEGLDGTLRVMKHLNMHDKAVAEPSSVNVYCKSSSWIRAKASGIFQSNVKNGQAVAKGQIVGHITDPFGDFKVPVKSTYHGYVIGLNNNPIIHQGDAVMHIGIEKE
ncbi:MAG: succinylglutamate desuccinylase/aspartoacylase family protein [Bacteroidota bacterium]